MVFFILFFLNNIFLIKTAKRNTTLSSEILRIGYNNSYENTSICLLYYYEKYRIIDLNDYEDKEKYGIECNNQYVEYKYSQDYDDITFENKQNNLISIVCGSKEEKNDTILPLCGYQLIYSQFIVEYAHIFGNFNIVGGFIVNFFQLRYPNSSLWISILNSLLFFTEELFNAFTTQNNEKSSSSIWIFVLIFFLFLLSLYILKFIHKKENIICGLYMCFFSYTLLKIIYFSLIYYFILKQLYILIAIIPFFIIGIMIGNKDNKSNITIITTPFIGAYILIKGLNYLLGGLTNEILLNKFYEYYDPNKQDKKPLYISTESINTYIIFYFILSIIGFQHQYRTGKELIEFPDTFLITDEYIDYGIEPNKENVFEMSKSIIEDNNTSSINNESIATNRASIQGDL